MATIFQFQGHTRGDTDASLGKKFSANCSKCLIFFIILFFAGCSCKKQEINAITQDKNFKEAFLNKTIDVVAPGSGTETKKIQMLQSLPCFNVNIPEKLVTNDIILHANIDAERFKFLKKSLFDNSKSKLVWCLRGGYGSARLIDALEKLPKPKNEKIFIGFSDVTALHLFLSQRWGWKTIHGAGLVEILNAEKDPTNFQKISEIISGKLVYLKINDLKPLNNQARRLKKISGVLSGGNISIVQSSIGTSWQIQTNGKILFLEDTGEKGYKIDRMLNHLKQAGLFRNIKAIVFGDFVNSEDNFVGFALERFALESNVPVFKSSQFGHGTMNCPLIYNSKSEIVFHHNNEDFSLIMHLKG